MSVRHSLSKALKSLESEFQTLNRVEISRSAILHNFNLFQAFSLTSAIIPVLKANAYGHGLEQVAEILKARQFPYIAVDGYFEALRIREVSAQPLLIMGAILPENFKRMKYKDLTFVVHDHTTIEALGNLAKPITVHLEIDTGMSRHGIHTSELPEILATLSKFPKLHLEGVMSHLADSDNPDAGFTETQTERFDATVEQILKAGFKTTLFHLAQTAGSTKVNSRFANAIRVGIGLYGVNPLEKTDPFYSVLENIQPTLQIISTITKVLTLEPGDTVSYGRTFTAKKPMKIGVLPIGYYEAIPRELSNCGTVVWENTSLPIVGRVNMNHTMIDLTGTTAKPFDEVIVLGGNSTLPTSITSISEKNALFSYGLLTRINENLRRVIV